MTPGTKLSSYEILSQIGAGGMGEVYRAHDPKLGRDVAIKVLPEAFARDAERMARFQREAKVLASLDHPNIASIYGLEDSGGTRALVMQLVEGPTLADRIKAGPIPVDESVRIAKQIADALEYAHERGIVHRDLKPANVKVTNDDAVKVLDFGLAKALEGDPSSIDISTSPTISRMATMQGVLLGTAAYMSPEQAKAKSVDRRADIWAFGCVLYEMLTGKQAFTGETVTDTLASIIKEEPDWKLLPAAVPMRVRVLLQRCLQKDPKQRLRDVGDARISLDEILSGAPESAPALGVAAAPSVWHRALPWVLLGVTGIALAAVSWVHFRERPPVPVEPVRLEIALPEKAALAPPFALSPDGRKLAFLMAGTDGVLRLWVRALDSPEARPLQGSETPGGSPFFWSPDSRYIAFDAGGKLKKIDISGGPAETLCDVSGSVVGGSWNRDGVIIFGSLSGVIMRVSAGSGTASAVTNLDSSRSELMHVLPSFLPDGRHFIYLRDSSKPENRGIYIGSLDAMPEEQDSKLLLPSAYGPVYVQSSDPGLGRLLFVRDGRLMTQEFDVRHLQLVGEPVTVAENVGSYVHFGFFSASNNGNLVYRAGSGGRLSQLAWFDRQGKILGAVGEQGLYFAPALSPDGRRAVVGQIDPQTGRRSLWMVDFSRGTTTRFTFGNSDSRYAIWSSDGSSIIFNANPGGTYDLYQKPANGSEDEKLLLKSNENKIPDNVSRDGHFLLYSSIDPKGRSQPWVLPLTGDQKPFLFHQTEFRERAGQFSPDGHWITYSSDESGRFEIYVRKFSPDLAPAASNTSAKWQVSYGGGVEPRWGTDGKELYYVTLDWKVMVVDVSTNPVFQAGTPKLLFQAAPQPSSIDSDYTVDGKRFLFSSPTEQTTQAPFMVVLNWPSLLKKWRRERNSARIKSLLRFSS
jgi:Tol biopolymer transport system component